MISYVSGKLVHKDPNYVVIETGGIGYEIRISLNTYSRLGKGEQQKLYTYFQVREDAQVLFGFADQEEKHLFELLIGISGVGGNTALMVLSSLSGTELKNAIAKEDVGAFKRVKGVGAKTAARIVLELKDKLTGMEPSGSIGGPAPAVRQEALTALVALGFPKAQMEKKLDKLIGDLDDLPSVEELIRKALKSA